MSIIPNKLHFIWIGNPLPSLNVETLLRWAVHNPLYEVHLWTEPNSIDAQIEKIKEGFKQLSDVIAEDIVHVEETAAGRVVQLFKAPMSPVFIRVYSITYLQPISDTTLLYEEITAWRNYGAASDILRIWVLYNMGGIYMDLDTFSIGRPLPLSITAPNDILFGESEGINYGLGNHIIASAEGGFLLLSLANSMDEAYSYSAPCVSPGVREILESEKYRYETIEGIRRKIAELGPSENSRLRSLTSSLSFCMEPVIQRTGPKKVIKWLGSLHGTDVDTGISVSFCNRDVEVVHDIDEGTKCQYSPEIEALYSFQKQANYYPKIASHCSWVK